LLEIITFLSDDSTCEVDRYIIKNSAGDEIATALLEEAIEVEQDGEAILKLLYNFDVTPGCDDYTFRGETRGAKGAEVVKRICVCGEETIAQVLDGPQTLTEMPRDDTRLIFS